MIFHSKGYNALFNIIDKIMKIKLKNKNKLRKMNKKQKTKTIKYQLKKRMLEVKKIKQLI